jgi:mRNA interferase RelE/StbE
MSTETRIKFSSRAVKDFKKLEAEVKDRIKRSLKDLISGKRKLDIRKLRGVQGREDLFRLRVGDHRVIYLQKKNEILIIRIEHRKKAYDFLD